MSSTDYINAAAASKIMMFSAYSGPFLEENDDSRRAVKPIVVKDQAYDGQTQ